MSGYIKMKSGFKSLLRFKFLSLGMLFYMLSLNTTAQIHQSLGQLEIKNFSPKSYKSHPQNWAVIQDKSGLMYFGNNLGVLIYDGSTWDLIKTENESTVRSMDVSPMGKVYIGASGDFGFLEADDHGVNRYVSLRKLYNLDEDEVGNIYYVSAFDQGVYFMSENTIYFYNGQTLRLWGYEEGFQSALKINANFIVNKNELGLSRMLDDSLISISGVNDFSDKKIIDILSYSNDDHVVLTEKNGLVPYYIKRTESRLSNQFLENINTSIKNINPVNIVKLKNGFLSIGTWGNGLMIVDREGDIVQEYNSLNGLLDEVITDQFIDRNGNLWITTSNGITKITVNEDIASFREKANLNETVEKTVEFNGRLYVASHTGLFYWEETKKSGSFKKVPNFNSECWDIMSVQLNGVDKLLVAGNNAIYQLDRNNQLEKIVSCLPWKFHSLKADPSTVLVGLDDGLMCLKYDGETWVIQNQVAGITSTIYSIAQKEDDRVWLGTMHDGVIRLDLRERITHYPYQFEARKFNQENGLPEGGVYVCEYIGGILFGTSDGLFSFNEQSNSFSEEKIYKETIGMDHLVIHRISENSLGNLWVMAYWEDEFILGYFTREGSQPKWHSESLKSISHEVFHTIYHQNERVTWLGGPDGLFRYEDGMEEQNRGSFAVLIRGVDLNNDSVDFAGNMPTLNYGKPEEKSPVDFTYPFEFNSITFRFSSQYHKYPELSNYSYKLIGFSEEWSDWTTDKKAVYTNLYEGKYVFKVKSRNAYGIESEVSNFVFTIKAPWYRTWWAYSIYGVLSVIVIYLVVVFYTRKLKEIIKERTAEVVEQKEEIEKQKDEVEHQRKLLEIKNADITSSINYAKRLQEALFPTNEFMDKYLKEHFILYKPKDIVSGDFYWMEHLNGIPGRDITLFATVDCTGHGVPGAFVSVVGNGGLNRAVNEFGLVQPSEILEKLNEIVVDTLSKGEEELRDGMDISLVMLDMAKMELQFAGANNSVYIFRKGIEEMIGEVNGNAKFYKGDLYEIKANKQPIGYYEFHKNFQNNTVKIQKGDVIYLFSDGFTDQFGGPKCKKYNVTRFRNFLLSIYDQPMSTQKRLVEKEFETWKGGEEQIDDVIVAGIRI